MCALNHSPMESKGQVDEDVSRAEETAQTGEKD